MEKRINAVTFNLEDTTEQFKLLEQNFSENELVKYQVIRLYKELNHFISKDGQAVIIFKIERKTELVQILAVLKANYDLVKKGLLRPICLLGVQSKKVEKLLYKYGCQDLLDLAIKPKTLNRKVDLAVRSINGILNTEDIEPLKLGQRSQDLPSIQDDENETEDDNFLESTDEIEEELDSLVNQFEDSIDEDDQLDPEFNNLIDELDENDFSTTNETSVDREKELSFSTTEESSPEIVEYIEDSGDIGHLNLETGYLGFVLNSDSDNTKDCVFESFDEKQMILEVAHDYQASKDESLNVWVKFIYNKCRVEIELSGKISEIENVDNGLKHITVDFENSEVEIYNYFMSLYEKRQKNINEFMELARGL